MLRAVVLPAGATRSEGERMLGWEGIAEVAAALRLSADETLLDLACGRGDYGLEIAARVPATRTVSNSRMRPPAPAGLVLMSITPGKGPGQLNAPLASS